MNNPIARFSGVSKSYARGWLSPAGRWAVREVSFTVEPAEIFGLVGPNRAGKTTLLKILLTLCRPSGGQVWRLGRPVDDRRTLSAVGYVHESQALPRHLSALNILEFYAALNGHTGPAIHQRIRQLLDRYALADRAREPISRFSKGMLQRLALAQALVGNPELLVLDEPSEGMDLAARDLVRETLLEHRRAGRAAILVSHCLADVERLCDRVAVLRGGRLEFCGRVSELTGPRPDGPRRALDQVLRPYYEPACC